MERKLKQVHGNWVVGERFWNRDEEIERFVEMLDEGAHILLVAPRRIGKTSLMREVARRIEGRYVCLHVDVQKSLTAEDALVELSVATRPHRTLWRRTTETFANVLQQVRDNVESLKIDDLTLTLRAGMTAGDWRVKGDAIFASLAESDSPVVLFIDEIAILVNRILKGNNYAITPERIRDVDVFMSWLRDNSIRVKGEVRIVMAGSIGIEPILSQAGLSATLNTFAAFQLPPWTADTAIECLNALSNQYGICFGPGTCERMVEKVGYCIPHHVQMFFDSVYTECKLRKTTDVTLDLVEEVYPTRMLGVRGHAELSHLEERLRMVLGAEVYPFALEILTEAAVEGRLSADAALFISRQYTFDPQTPDDVLRQVLRILEHDGYLEKGENGFGFISKLLRDWWKARFQFGHIPVSERRARECQSV